MANRLSAFTGVGVALITVFTRDGDLCTQATTAHATQLVDEGVKAVLIAGTTGEAMTLDPDERSLLLKEVGHSIGGRVPLIAGTGAPSARQAVALTRRAAADGADAVLALTPPWGGRPKILLRAGRGLDRHPAACLPLPSGVRTRSTDRGLGRPTGRRLKDSSGDAERLIRECDELPIGLYTGHHSLLLLAGAIGCSGAIVALANLDVEGCTRAWQGDPEVQRRVVSDHGDLGSSAALKRRVSALRGTSPASRVG